MILKKLRAKLSKLKINKQRKAQFDFLDSPVPIVLGVIGAAVALFTASGGFSKAVTGESFNPGIFIKVIATLIGGIIGFIWGKSISD